MIQIAAFAPALEHSDRSNHEESNCNDGKNLEQHTRLLATRSSRIDRFSRRDTNHVGVKWLGELLATARLLGWAWPE